MTDGRNARSAATHARILATCRDLMVRGDFRPSVREVATAAGCSFRSVFQHFNGVEGMHRAALDDATTTAIAGMIFARPVDHDTCIVHAAVFGRPMPADAGGAS